ncbi:MAG: glycosyltransferase [Pseudomonadota bacterium]|nr:glycosyltransferase [Pseudomonadota bacterium]
MGRLIGLLRACLRPVDRRIPSLGWYLKYAYLKGEVVWAERWRWRKRPANRTDFPPWPVRKRPPAHDIRIACILDPFSASCFEPEAHLTHLSARHWRRQVEAERPAFLLVESAWRGLDGEWHLFVSHFAQMRRNPLRDLLDWCRENSVPTAFWNKEDPPNFDHFIAAAKEFDFIFTTDANCIGRYRTFCGHDQVYTLPFAAQPAIHNPIRNSKPVADICFAGTWYGDKYRDRCQGLEALLDAAMRYDLHIFDRQYGHVDPRYAFPVRFAPFIQGSLSYDRMLSAFRAYRVFLNVNSVTDSPTMFARRVFELLACGTPVISTPSVGMEVMLGDYVRVAHDEKDASAELDALLGDEDARRKLSHLGARHVLTHHTYAHCLAAICKAIGIDLPQATPPRVAIQIENGDPALRAMAEAQSYPACDIGGAGDWIAPLRQGHAYGPNYIADLVLAARYSGADIIGKIARFQLRDGRAMLVEGESACRYMDIRPERAALYRAAMPDSPSGFTADPYNYVENGASAGLLTEDIVI